MNVLLTSYLEPEQVARLRLVDPRLRILYEPELLRPPRYPADHTGRPVTRTAAQEARWQALLAEADILFDFDQSHLADLPALTPNVRWIQATSAGIGQLMQRYNYAARMPHTRFTTASGIHARPLAEFCLLAMLWFIKDVPHLHTAQAARRWERFARPELADHTLAIVGVGQIGQEVARLAKAFGMRVIGNKRTVSGVDPRALHLDALYGANQLHTMLPQADILCLIAPYTTETEHLIGAAELAMLPPGALLINIGRGAVVDEAALIDALARGTLGGAALDVFATEPLPPGSPLWLLPNVLLSPHSASTSLAENRRLIDLFSENLRRWLAHEPLLNLFDRARAY